MKYISTYAIQEWLFNEAEGQFDIDLAESGIQYRHFHDLNLTYNYDLNYSLDRGHLALRQRISLMYGVDVSQVMVTHGSQEALYLFYNCFLAPSDHVITFSPGWQQSWEVPKFIGSEVTVIELEGKNNYQIDISLLKKNIKQNTKLIILNSPNNPTGTQISNEIRRELLIFCEENGIFLINDEEYLTQYKNSIIHQYKQQSASVSSLSKVYGFPGLRLGWFVGPQSIVEKMVNHKRYVTVTNSSLCEYLGHQVLSKQDFYLEQYHELIKERLPLLKSIMTKYDEFEIIEPQDTPYVYIKMPNYNSWTFSRSLLKEKQVLVMPAEVFQSKNAIRVSFVREPAVLENGLIKLCSHFEKFHSAKRE